MSKGEERGHMQTTQCKPDHLPVEVTTGGARTSVQIPEIRDPAWLQVLYGDIFVAEALTRLTRRPGSAFYKI
jgi:hypothetical protein